MSRSPERRSQNSAAENVNSPFLDVHAHLVVKREFGAPHMSSVFGDERPRIALYIVHVKVALEVFLGPVLSVKVTSQSEDLTSFRIKTDFMARPGAGAALE